MNVLIFGIPNSRIFMERDTVVAKFALDTFTYRENKTVDFILMYYMSEFSPKVNSDGLCASKNNAVCFSEKRCEKVHHI